MEKRGLEEHLPSMHATLGLTISNTHTHTHTCMHTRTKVYVVHSIWGSQAQWQHWISFGEDLMTTQREHMWGAEITWWDRKPESALGTRHTFTTTISWEPIRVPWEPPHFLLRTAPSETSPRVTLKGPTTSQHCHAEDQTHETLWNIYT
jgi:hypothetical protein